MPQLPTLWQIAGMKNGSPEDLDFTSDEDFAVFAVGGSKRKHFRRKGKARRKRIRVNHGKRLHG